MSKVYSKLDSLPYGNASNEFTDGCVIVEGGAFRGIYAAAVMDVLMQNNINLKCLVGVSAGALNGMNYISGQIGRSAKITLMHRFDKEYVGYKTLFKDKGIFGFSYCFNYLINKHKFDFDRFYSGNQRFIITATNVFNGKTTYFESGKCDLFKALQASASLPFFSKVVLIDGIPYLDGGCSEKIPYKWAFENGYKKVLIIKTQPDSYKKPATSKLTKIASKLFYGKYKKFAEALCKNNESYNKCLDEIEVLKKNGDVFVISPSAPVNVSRFEKDIEKIGNLYELGFNDATKLLPEIKKYFGI